MSEEEKHKVNLLKERIKELEEEVDDYEKFLSQLSNDALRFRYAGFNSRKKILDKMLENDK